MTHSRGRANRQNVFERDRGSRQAVFEGGRGSRQTVFETAFVSSRVSSAEDLDEVDRLANHPLLQECHIIINNKILYTENRMEIYLYNVVSMCLKS